MNPATEALEKIEEVSRFPNRIKKALSPESDEDRAMCDAEVSGDEQ